MASITVDFDVVCEKCGNDLWNGVTETQKRNGDWVIKVEPCQACMDDSFADGKMEAEREGE